MRGVSKAKLSQAPWRGIIPAHAGSIEPFDVCITILRDHPRSCGEYAHYRPRRAAALGSSPLMRGVLFDMPT